MPNITLNKFVNKTVSFQIIQMEMNSNILNIFNFA